MFGFTPAQKTYKDFCDDAFANMKQCFPNFKAIAQLVSTAKATLSILEFESFTQYFTKTANEAYHQCK
jgi:hypothetical protein